MNIAPPLSGIVFFTLSLLGSLLPAPARTIKSLDEDWSFFQGDAPGAEKPGTDTSAWRKVSVPHDWSIEGNFRKDAPTTGSGGWLPSGVAWYRREFTMPAEAKGQRVWVEFDGVMANSDVWINGHLLGHRPNGYVSFRYDLTDHLKPGESNLLVVRADTSAQPASRWYSGAGIYRHVRLVTVASGACRAVGSLHHHSRGHRCSRHGENPNQLEKHLREVRHTSPCAVLSSHPAVKRSPPPVPKVTLEPGKQDTVAQQIKVPNPQLWSLESPQLHTLVTRITDGETVLDEVTTPFGIRTAEFKSETGFWLNGKNVKLKGVCLHHDGGAVGAAVPLAVWERRLKILQDLGVNAIRTAHNPHRPRVSRPLRHDGLPRHG